MKGIRINQAVLILAAIVIAYGVVIATYFVGKRHKKAEPTPEFTVSDVPSKSESNQSVEVYKVVGQGRTCYVVGFGVSKVLLWCENGTPSTGEIKGWNCDASKLEWIAKQEQEH